MSQVSIIAIRALTAAVEGAGGDREVFLAEAGLAPALLADDRARVSLADYARARRAALHVSGDPALGLHMGGHASTGRFDLMGALAENSRSLREFAPHRQTHARKQCAGLQLHMAWPAPP